MGMADSRESGPEPRISADTAESSALLETYFSSARQLFMRSLEPGGKPIKRHFALCGSTIELAFTDERLLPYLTQALEHLSIATAESPALTVCIWDDVTTNTELPAPPWFGYAVQDKGGNIEGLYTNRGDVRGFSSNRISTAYNWSANALSLYDRNEGIALYWTRNARVLPAYETSAPLRTILNWWAEERNFHFAHGAAVGTSHGGVLIAGKGGSGKSTAALAALKSGLLYVSDDYCLVTAEPAPAAYSVFSSAKVDPDNIFRVEHVAPARGNTGNPHDDKAVFFLYPRFAGQITPGFPLRAILLPRISGKRDSILSPASKQDCIRALTLSTMCQFPGAGKKAVDILLRLAEALPCYYLEFGTDLAQAPDLILELLDKGREGKL
jgi:hypothetical protein